MLLSGVEHLVRKMRQAFLDLEQRLSDNPIDAFAIIKPKVEADAGGSLNVIWPEIDDE
ncbi:hypothetical protein [Rosistilla carotiformis]|uniref:hypothetical protein n=1 Tax=Rosistilla carotiformis TaxID=2528017 RepID=UPI0018D20646|nr:hypothetical protein [Rosistilla carotiformis]